MSDTTGIEWTDSTWNPVTGCDEVSPGCDRCYAKTFAERWRGIPGHYFENGFDVQLRPDKLGLPLRWRKPRKVFVNSMSDLFHKDVPDEYIARVFAIMALTPQHTYQILTKRQGRMRSLLTSGDWQHQMRVGVHNTLAENIEDYRSGRLPASLEWPLPNVHLGVSVEDQKRADLRIPALLDTPAAVRFLSCEPLLGPVDLGVSVPIGPDDDRKPMVDWVIVGGESGHGARPMHPDWARTIRDQCVQAGVPFHFKQWGEWAPEAVCATRTGAASALYIELDGSTRPAARGARGDAVTVQRNGKKHTGRRLDGRTWDQFPSRPDTEGTPA